MRGTTRRRVLHVAIASRPPTIHSSSTERKIMFSLPDLPYGYDALEPHIDARTMDIHHTKLHAACESNLNAALEKEPALEGARWSSF